MNPNEDISAFQDCDCQELGQFPVICSFDLEWSRLCERRLGIWFVTLLGNII